MILDELHIKDLALIDEAWIAFGPGMSVLTGETGTGKTVLLGAVKMLLGERADSTMVRSGASEALVEGRFVSDGDETFVKRRLTADGRSRCALDGEMVPVSALAARVGPLVDLHGQHEHQALLSPATHVTHLDAWIGEEAAACLEAYSSARAAYREALEERDRVSGEIARTREDAERLARLVSDVEAVAPVRGEDEEIEARLPQLRHAERLSEAAAEASALLRGDGGAHESAARARSSLERVRGIDPSLDALSEQIEGAEALLDDVGHSLREYRDRIAHDPASLDALESRLAVLTSLMRRYGPRLDDVIEAHARATAALAAAGEASHVLERLEAEVAAARKACEGAAEALEDLRRRAAPRFARAVGEVMAELALDGARIEVSFEGLSFDAWRPDGPCRVEFLYAPAPGQPARPLAKIASGGELSRLMLALKGVTGRDSGATVLLFDEVDAGIGGATATEVGRRLCALARTHQVIVVTHLAQVAAFAQTHLTVRKLIEGDRAFTVVEHVTGDARISEIARMLSGADTEASRAHARELLDAAGRATNA